MKLAKPAKNVLAPNTKHGLTVMKAALKQLGERALDKRTSLAIALKRWKHEILNDLGGEEHVSAQHKAILDIAVNTKLLLDSVDAYLLTQQTIVNKRKRCLYPIVLQRQQIADALSRSMTQLGLERRARAVPSLREYLAGKESGR